MMMLWVALLGAAWAGSPSSAAEAGIEALTNGNLDRAVADLDEALVKPEKLKGTLRAEAHLSRAIARTGLATERPELAPAAVDDLLAAAAADPDGTLSGRLVDAQTALFTELDTLSKARSASGDATGAKEMLEAAATLRPDVVDVRYRLCTAASDLQDSPLAKAHCPDALRLARTDAAAEPDPAFAQAGLVLASAHDDPAEQQAALAEGLAVLAELDKRRATHRDLYTDDQWAKTEATRDSIKAALEQGASSSGGAPAELPQGVDALKAAVGADPGNYTLMLAYGDALDDAGDLDGAAAQYEAAIPLEPDRTTAIVRLANVWVGRAAAAQGEMPVDVVVELMSHAHELLKKAHEIAPDDPGITQGLLQACTVVEDAACIAELGG